MATPKMIKIERKPDKTLQPVGALRQKLKAGSDVLFTIAPPLGGLTITFRGKSPFGVRTVNYGEIHTVKVTHDSANPSKNVFKFDCEDPKAGDGPSRNGGELEIIPGP
jgi:hypothetical protein